MVTDGDMSAAAKLAAAYVETFLETSRYSVKRASRVKPEDESSSAAKKAELLRKEDENTAFDSLNAVTDEQIVKYFEFFLCEVVEVRLRLENHLTKNAFKSVYGKKEGREIPLDTNAPELFEPLPG